MPAIGESEKAQVEIVDLAELAAADPRILGANAVDWQFDRAENEPGVGCGSIAPDPDSVVLHFYCAQAGRIVPAQAISITRADAVVRQWIQGPDADKQAAGQSGGVPEGTVAVTSVVDDVLVIDFLTDPHLFGHFPTGGALEMSLRNATEGTRSWSLLIQHVPYCEKEGLCGG